MNPLITITGKDVETKLGQFTSTNFQQITWDKNDEVIAGIPSKQAEIMVRIKDDVDLTYAEQCAKHFNQLPKTTIIKLCEHSFKHCQSYCEYFGEETPKLKKLEEILYYMEPFCMHIEAPKGHDIAYIIDLHCDWSPEHGLSWIIRNDEILYVGEGMVHFHLKASETLDSYKNDPGNFVFGVHPNWGQ